MASTVTDDQRHLTALRLTAQGIASPSAESPAAAVRHSLAMQAQDFAGVLWSIGLRTPGTTDAAIESALAAREIVRSWPMRGTLHVVAPEDLAWMLSITTPRLVRGAARRREQLGLSDADLDSARTIAAQSLEGGRVLGRDELLAAFEEGGVSTASQRGYHILWMLSQTGLLVFGPVATTANGTRKQTFTLLDEWVPEPRELTRDEALGEFALRYFTSHGPATVKDLAWWASLTLAEARAGLAVARDRLEELVIGGVGYFARARLEPAASGVHLLPGFDEYLLGYQDRSAALAPEIAGRVVPGNNGVFKPTIVVDGAVIGTWRRTTTRTRVTVEPEPFTPLSKRVRADVAAAAERYAAFLALELR